MSTKTLIFAIDRDKFVTWRDTTGAHDAQKTIVVTADWQVAEELEATGLPYREVWSYLKAADIDRAQKLCQELAAEWWRPFLGKTEYKGMCLADAMSREMWYAFTMRLMPPHRSVWHVTRINLLTNLEMMILQLNLIVTRWRNYFTIANVKSAIQVSLFVSLRFFNHEYN